VLKRIPPLLPKVGRKGRGVNGVSTIGFLIIEGSPPAQPVADAKDEHGTNPEQGI
jgi:hypothetical protein